MTRSPHVWSFPVQEKVIKGSLSMGDFLKGVFGKSVAIIGGRLPAFSYILDLKPDMSQH